MIIARILPPELYYAMSVAVKFLQFCVLLPIYLTLEMLLLVFKILQLTEVEGRYSDKKFKSSS